MPTLARVLSTFIGTLLLATSTLANAGTALFYHSQPGDLVGFGKTQSIAPADGYTVTASIINNTLYVEFLAPDVDWPLGYQWTLQLQGANGQIPTVGHYPNASSPFGAGHPGLAFLGDLASRSHCRDETAGSFEVLELTLGPTGSVASFAANFEQHCLGRIPGVFGQIRFNNSIPIDPTLRWPDPFSFPAVAGASPGAAIVSAPATLGGFEVPLPITVAGAEYSIDNGPFTAAPGVVSAGQQLRLRLAASPQDNAVTSGDVTVGGYTTTFVVGTAPGANPQPNGNSLVVLISQGKNWIGKGSNYVYSPATLATFSSQTTIRNGALMRVETPDGGYWQFEFAAPYDVPLTTGVFNSARHSVQGSPGLDVATNGATCYTVDGQFTVHEIVRGDTGIESLAVDFVQYCQESPDPLYGYIRFNSGIPVVQIADTTPRPFTFNPVVGAARNAWVESGSRIVDSINVAAPVSVVGGEYSIGGAPFTSAAGTISLGQSLTVRLLAANTFSTSSTATLTVGTYSTDFVVQTVAPDWTPDWFDFGGVTKAPLAQWIPSPVVQISGIDDAAPVFPVGCEFSIDGQPFSDGTATINSGQSIQVRVMSGGVPDDTQIGYLRIGNFFGDFVVRTSRLPPAPAILAVTSGDRKASISFDPTFDALASPATSYTATCNPGAIAASAAVSPIVVPGLTNDVVYACTVTATNAVGTGAPSAVGAASPASSSGPVLVSVKSRRAHGAQTFDLALSAEPTTPTIEPRFGGPGGNHAIVFSFDVPVTSGTAHVVSGVATAGAPLFNGNEIIVPLSGVANAQYVNLAVTNVTAGDGGTPASGSTRIGFLIGDTDGSRSVSLTDMLLVNSVLTQPVTASNFLQDIDASGTLTVTDKLYINANLTQVLPAP